MADTLLLIDDDVSWCQAMEMILTDNGFKVETAHDALSGLQKAYAVTPDAILLDLMLPGMDGWQVCSRLREMSDMPIIMLTSLSRSEYLVKGLNTGADEYIVKSVGVKELIARIRAVLRRTAPASSDQKNQHHSLFTFEHLVVDFKKHEVQVDGRRINLTPTEFRLLSIFIRYRGRVLPHEFLLKQVWGPDYGRESISLRLYIGYLRRKIEKNPALPQLIQNEWGVGYRFG